MLNRLFNLTRRDEPQAFPPRKRVMTSTSFGQPRPEDGDLATFIVEDAEPGATPFGALEQLRRPPGRSRGRGSRSGRCGSRSRTAC